MPSLGCRACVARGISEKVAVWWRVLRRAVVAQKSRLRCRLSEARIVPRERYRGRLLFGGGELGASRSTSF